MAKNKNRPADTMSRKYHICLNNPTDHGFSQERIIEIISGFKSLRYACGGMEVGEQGTPHWHIYCLFKNAVRHSTMRRAFDNNANIQNAKGSSLENKAYILKEGRHESKASTKVPDTFFEIGVFPDDEKPQQGYRTDLSLLVDLVRDNSSISSIMATSPSYIRYIGHIEKLRSALDKENAHKSIRDLDVVYIFGGKASDRLAYIYDKYGIENVFRCVHFDKHSYDGYENEKVMFYDNFKDSFPLQDMINLYLSPFPLSLACRYNNRNAVYTTAVISSRTCPEDLYIDGDSTDRQELFDKLDTVIQMHADGSVSTYTGTEYFDPERLAKDTDSPFQ